MPFECSVGDWHRKKDPGTGAYYYANAKTLLASWTVPPEWVEPPLPGGGAPLLTVENSWTEVTDPNSGRLYYVNTMTMESSWERPPNFKDPRTGDLNVQSPAQDPDTSDDEAKTPISARRARISAALNASLAKSFKLSPKHSPHLTPSLSQSKIDISDQKLDLTQPQHLQQQITPSLSQSNISDQKLDLAQHLPQHLQKQQQKQTFQASQLPTATTTQSSESTQAVSRTSLSTTTATTATTSITSVITPDKAKSAAPRFVEGMTPRLEQALALSKLEWTQAQRASAPAAKLTAIRSLIRDEFTYFTDLQVIGVELEVILHAQKEAGKEGLSPGELRVITKNIPDLYAVHLVFAQSLKSLTTDDQLLSPVIINLLNQLFSSFNAYANYISSHKSVKNVHTFVERLEGERPGLKAALDHLRSAKCVSGSAQSLQHYLDAPATRPPVYGQLVFNILKTIDPLSEDFKAWHDVLTKAEHTAQRIEQSAEFITMRDKVADIQRRLHFVNSNEIGLQLVTPTRHLVHVGEIKKKLAKKRLGSSYKTYSFYIFNDMAMYASLPDKLKRIVPKRLMPMVGMKVDAAEKDVNFRIDSIVKNVQFKAASREERDQWVRILQECIRRCNDDHDHSRRKNQVLISPDRGW